MPRTRVLRFEDLTQVFDAWEQEINQLRAVAEAAQVLVDEVWMGRSDQDLELYSIQEVNLVQALHALRSGDADRGVRDPGTPGEQEPDAEQAHGEAVHPGGKP